MLIISLMTVEVQEVSMATCNRCNTSGLGWCRSRATGKPYLAWEVPTPTVAPDGKTVVSVLKAQPNLLHRCGETVEQSRAQAADYAAERARLKAGSQPTTAAPTAAPTATKTARKAKAPAAGVAAIRERERANGQPVNAQQPSWPRTLPGSRAVGMVQDWMGL